MALPKKQKCPKCGKMIDCLLLVHNRGKASVFRLEPNSEDISGFLQAFYKPAIDLGQDELKGDFRCPRCNRTVIPQAPYRQNEDLAALFLLGDYWKEDDRGVRGVLEAALGAKCPWWEVK